METIASLHRISRERLSSLILSPDSSKLAIIDVRDDDHVGGHIRKSTHTPSSSLDFQLPKVVEELADKEIVVFHCALSQQRGPGAALRYLRERDAMLREQGILESPDDIQRAGSKGGSEGSEEVKESKQKEELVRADEGKEVDVAGDPISGIKKSSKRNQQVYVLDGGFVKWQEKYVVADRC